MIYDIYIHTIIYDPYDVSHRFLWTRSLRRCVPTETLSWRRLLVLVFDSDIARDGMFLRIVFVKFYFLIFMYVYCYSILYIENQLGEHTVTSSTMVYGC